MKTTQLTRDEVLSAIELLPCIAEGMLRYELWELIEEAERHGIDPDPIRFYVTLAETS